MGFLADRGCGARAILENLEQRTLLSVLPPTSVAINVAGGGQIQYGDPTDPAHDFVLVQWQDTNGGQAQYRVQFANHDGSNWQPLPSGDTQAGATSALHVLDSGYKYDYRVLGVEGTDVSAPSQVVSPKVAQDYSLSPSASVTSAGAVTLHWQKLEVYDPQYVNYSIYRRYVGTNDWGDPIADGLDGTSTQWTDPTALVPNQAMQYWVRRTGASGDSGICYASFAAVPMQRWGTALLVEDETLTSDLAESIGVLESDLVGAGWKVKLLTVPRDDDDPYVRRNVDTVKAAIQQVYEQGDLRSIFLIGHVPVPYSGLRDDPNNSGKAFDGHFDHNGAWNADMYYGDLSVAPGDWTLTGSYTHADRVAEIKVARSWWTDDQLEQDANLFIQNDNTTTDGKFDQSVLASGDNIEVPVGRVDFGNLQWDMPGSQRDVEVALLKRYFEKDHQYRMGDFSVQRSALVDDHFGTTLGDWQELGPIVGFDNTVAADWKTGLTSPGGYLFAVGHGGGELYPSLSQGVAAATDYNHDAQDFRGVFNFIRASYTSDWNLDPSNPGEADRSSDNLLKTMLASTGYALDVATELNAPWIVDGMGAGGLIGDALLATQNSIRKTYISLLGDPTLRMDVVKPATDVVAKPDASGVELSWTASADSELSSFAGYRIYRGYANGTDFGLSIWTPVASGVTGTTLTDTTALGSGVYVYMVRAENLQSGDSGSYYNLSQGTFGVAILGSTGDDAYTIAGTASAGDTLPANLQIFSGATPTGTPLLAIPMISLQFLVIGGGTGNDIVVLDSSLGGIGSLGVSFDGGGGTDTFYANGNSGISGKLNFNVGNYTTPAASTVNVRYAAVIFMTTQVLGKLTITDGHEAMLAPRASAPTSAQARVLVLDGLDLGPVGAETGALDLQDNDLVVNYGSEPTPFSTIWNYVMDGYSSEPDPSKMGIISTAGQNTDGSTILGLFDNGDAGMQTTWMEIDISPNSVIGKYTYTGDTNLDGQVTADDYGALDANFDEYVDIRVAWITGDINWDGRITADDYGGLDANFGHGVGDPL